VVCEGVETSGSAEGGAYESAIVSSADSINSTGNAIVSSLIGEKGMCEQHYGRHQLLFLSARAERAKILNKRSHNAQRTALMIMTRMSSTLLPATRSGLRRRQE